jgi:hypothetical protein
MKINRTTAVIVGLALLALFALDAWGDQLGMAPHALARIQRAVAGLSILAAGAAGKLLSVDKDGDGVPDWLQKILGLVLALGVLVGSGCGGPQAVISTQAEILVATQPARFDAYGVLSERCEAGAESLEAYSECMAPARHVARAADSYRESLYAAQAAINLGGGGPAVGCAIEASRRFLAALQAANLPIPGEVSTIAAMIPEVSCGE